MPFRIYIVPVLVTVIPGKGSFRSVKYMNDGTITPPDPSASILSYGNEPWAFVGANLSAVDDAMLVSKPDVEALPFDLSPTLTAGQVSGVKAFLEAANIAAGWVSTADTWLGVFHSVAGMFTFWMRYNTIYGQNNGGASAPSVFAGGVTLNTTFGALPAAVQAAIIATAQDQGISTAGLTAGTQLRAIEKSMADQYADNVYTFNDGTPNGHQV